MNAPLLWATRPQHQNTQWQRQLALLAETNTASLLDIAMTTSQNDIQKIKNFVMDLDQFQHVIFVSQNAVSFAFDWIDQYWPQLPVGLNFYAVGAKTAEVVRNHNAEVIECGEAMNSEGLLDLPELAEVDGQKVLICRGKGGRPTLADVLAERGATVKLCELYERLLPKAATQQFAALDSKRQNIIPLFSGETLQNLVHVLPPNCDKNTIVLVVPAKRVSDMAKDAGFTHIKIAPNASQAAMLATTRQCISQ